MKIGVIWRMHAIYSITHTSGRRYIGSSVDVRRRWTEHKRELLKGTHHNRYLQNAWLKHGAEAFVFEILEALPCRRSFGGTQGEYLPGELEQRFSREYFYLESFKDSGLYNLSFVPGSVMDGRNHTVETKAKMSRSHTGRKKTEAHKQSMRDSYTNGVRSPESLEKMRRKCAEKTGTKVAVLFPDGTEKSFQSLGQASREIGCAQPVLWLCIYKSKTMRTKGCIVRLL